VLRALQVGAVVEALSLLVLLVNRATAHLDPVTSLAGPVHGTAYLVVIGGALLLPQATRTARLLAVVPGIGGALALRHVARHPADPGDDR
jgi:hypothetical protein